MNSCKNQHVCTCTCVAAGGKGAQAHVTILIIEAAALGLSLQSPTSPATAMSLTTPKEGIFVLNFGASDNPINDGFIRAFHAALDAIDAYHAKTSSGVRVRPLISARPTLV